MDKDKLLKEHHKVIKDSFESWFQKEVLKGRKPLIADQTVRSYHFLYLFKAYILGIRTAFTIIQGVLEDKEKRK